MFARPPPTWPVATARTRKPRSSACLMAVCCSARLAFVLRVRTVMAIAASLQPEERCFQPLDQHVGGRVEDVILDRLFRALVRLLVVPEIGQHALRLLFGELVGLLGKLAPPLLKRLGYDVERDGGEGVEEVRRRDQ